MIDRQVIDCHAARLHYFFTTPMGHRTGGVPAHIDQNHIDRKYFQRGEAWTRIRAAARKFDVKPGDGGWRELKAVKHKKD